MTRNRTISSTTTTRLLLAGAVASASLAALTTPAPAAGPRNLPPIVLPTPAEEGPSIDLVLLLDTSSSMNGLIDQAKAQLWKIVNETADQTRDGEKAKVRVALFQYGNDGLPVTENYIRQVVPLTSDLDAVGTALFGLTTNGGSEYCGAVIDDALGVLDWSTGDDDYRTIFIAGNEPFTQGPIDYRVAVGEAKGRGVVVNTVHCGPSQAGESGEWTRAAAIGGGEAFNIDQDHSPVPQIICPQDEKLGRLSLELNETYLWFGDRERRDEAAGAQVANDMRMSRMSPSLAAVRAVTKANSVYDNAGRDLVDTLAGDVDALPTKLAEVPEDELPEAMQAMSANERVQHVKELAERRSSIQAQIQTLAAERATFLAAELARQADADAGQVTLGDAVTQAVARQLEDRGFDKVRPTTRPR
ncbi:MAG: vWA domain-containing protein [Planctomycetota bacterium]